MDIDYVYDQFVDEKAQNPQIFIYPWIIEGFPWAGGVGKYECSLGYILFWETVITLTLDKRDRMPTPRRPINRLPPCYNQGCQPLETKKREIFPFWREF